MESTNIEAPEDYQGIAAVENTEPAQALPESGKGFFLDKGHGHKNTLLSQLITTVVSSRDTGGRFSMCILEGPANEPVPAHFHTEEDEWFFVLEGKVRVWLDREHRLLYPGDCAYLPARVVHAFAFEGGYNKFLGLNVAGGFEDFFDIVGTRSEAFSAPDEFHEPTEEQWRKAGEAFAWHAVPDYDYGI
jgi:quercetin 2,3-dioxygenase